MNRFKFEQRKDELIMNNPILDSLDRTFELLEKDLEKPIGSDVVNGITELQMLGNFAHSDKMISIWLGQSEPTEDFPFRVNVHLLFTKDHCNLIRRIDLPESEGSGYFVRFIHRYRNLECFNESVLEVFDMESWLTVSEEEQMIFSCALKIGAIGTDIIYHYSI